MINHSNAENSLDLSNPKVALISPNSSSSAKGWAIRDLVIIGLMGALARALGLVSVFILGGMNPLSLTVRVMIITVIYIVLRHKVRRFGVLTLAVLVGSLTSFFIMAQGIVTLPIVLLGALMAEVFIVYIGRERSLAIIVGVALMSIFERGAALIFVWLNFRENLVLMVPALFMSTPGILGAFLGCLLAPGLVKELRHAAFINN
ncbi:MAG: MptD family putative ECF transporter S component [Deltaproteobacteria bacterium]|jgi:hypothetical protein|nr:MptD family putative ECF transporter S component [Deltaproteobacteria bacterium]